MRIQISITTETGAVYSGEVELSAVARERDTTKARPTRKETVPAVGQIDFSLPVRPFIKKYANGMSGPKRLALLVARVAEGDNSVQVQRSEVMKLWGRMTSLMGGAFNSAY